MPLRPSEPHAPARHWYRRVFPSSPGCENAYPTLSVEPTGAWVAMRIGPVLRRFSKFRGYSWAALICVSDKHHLLSQLLLGGASIGFKDRL